MSRTTWALIIKFLVTFAAAWLAFTGLRGNTLGWILMLAVVGTALNYLLGDLVILPRTGNIVAALADGVLAALTAYLLGAIAPGFHTTPGSLLAFGLVVAVAEFFFHLYLLNTRKVAP